MECEYNNACYETSDDGYYIEYLWNALPTLEAEYEVVYVIDDEEHTINVCEGCLEDIEDSCRENDNYEFISQKRIREHSKTCTKKRSGDNYYIRKPMTELEVEKWIQDWHKECSYLCKGTKGKCVKECYN